MTTYSSIGAHLFKECTLLLSISQKYFIVELLHYSEINHPDWLLQVKRQVLTNQFAIFQSGVVTLRRNFLMRLAPGLVFTRQN